MYMRDTIVFYAIWPRGVISFLKPHIEYFALNNYRVVVVTSSWFRSMVSSLPISIFTCGFSRSLKTLLNPFNYISFIKFSIAIENRILLLCILFLGSHLRLLLFHPCVSMFTISLVNSGLGIVNVALDIIFIGSLIWHLVVFLSVI